MPLSSICSSNVSSIVSYHTSSDEFSESILYTDGVYGAIPSTERLYVITYPLFSDASVLYDVSLYSHIRSVQPVSIMSEIPHPARKLSPCCIASSWLTVAVFAVSSPS